MPELAEVKIMSDFINYIASQEKFFYRIEKSPTTKVKTEFENLDDIVYSINAKSRGKELILFLEEFGNPVVKKLLVTLGMSGNFVYLKKDSPSYEKIMKHAHLRFKTIKGNYILLHDVRRFAKWRWAEDWSKGRGACPLTEFNKFSEFLRTNWYIHKAFNTPLNEIMLNQGLFNGIGNYLRAEILYRLNINPFQPANQLSSEERDFLIKITHFCCRDAYQMGGGELKDWVNQKGRDDESFDNWMKCYGKGNSIVDKTGRRFWYDAQWESYVPENYKK